MNRRERRDWRLAALGGGCSALGTACLLLAACSSNPQRPSAARVVAAPPMTPTKTSPIATPSWPIRSLTYLSPWQRLRHRFAMPGCDYNADVQHWARWYTEDPAGFRTSLSQAMPFLLVVLGQIEKRNLPGEFAFLPYIESNYTPLASSGDRAAGIWQLMPDTAREAGLRINRDYDGRLDVAASTTAALGLLQRYQQEFGDWRLADMAYNAGEYRIKKVVGNRHAPLSASEIARLRVNPGTHQHLAKLLALACIVSDPDRFNVDLPDPQVSDTLVEVPFPAPMDLHLAARLANLDPTRLEQLNPGYRHRRMPAQGPWHVLIPAVDQPSFELALAAIPPSDWRDWHDAILRQPETVSVLASASEIEPAILAAANQVNMDATLAAGTHLLLPGRGGNPRMAARDVAMVSPSKSVSTTTLVVQHGDTLWSIARRAHVHLDDLLSWNGLARNSTLRPGQRLRVHAPAAIVGAQASTTAVAAPN